MCEGNFLTLNAYWISTSYQNMFFWIYVLVLWFVNSQRLFVSKKLYEMFVLKHSALQKEIKIFFLMAKILRKLSFCVYLIEYLWKI